MILSVQRHVHDAIAAAARSRFGLDDLPPFAVEVPPNRALGDLGVTLAFQLARTLRKAPKAIALAIAGAVGDIPGVARIDAAPNGYLNLYLDRTTFLIARLRGEIPPPAVAPEKTIVEHTAINPNKAAHIGHLRNAALGDTLGRVLRFRGTPVEVQNYIDDTGVQVADVVIGAAEIEHLTAEDLRRIADSTRFDYYCWDLYARVTEWYEGDKARLAIRAQALHDLEHGGNETAAIGAFVVDRIVRAHLATMARLNIFYDLLTYEGDILRLQFWARAFEILEASGAMFLQTEGRLAGCWVMRIDEGDAATAEAPAAEGDAAGGGDEAAREKVIVRSNGVVTYVGKDIANQFWKFGLLGREFHYSVFGEQANGQTLWSTTSVAEAASTPRPAFGHAVRTYNVIDSRQMYLQALLSQALRTLGHPTEAENSIHFSYEMVGLSHATARELGYPADPDDLKKPFVEVSGRKGLGVKIDDLLDLLTAKASAEVTKRNPAFSAEETARIAGQIAVGAIRYFMLRFSRGKLIVFDIEEALSFEGETGPYLQYAVVRANNIFQRLRDRDGLTEADIVAALDSTPADELLGGGPGHQDAPSGVKDNAASGGEHRAPSGSEHSDQDALWALVLEASRLDEVIEQVVRSLEFSVLAKYTFHLAQLFNGFYHHAPILNEERADRKRWRAAGMAYARAQLTRALDLMGIKVPHGCRTGRALVPLIAISATQKIEDYRQAVLHTDGEVRVVDGAMGVDRALEGIDGLLLSGGNDVDPARYGETVHPTVTDVDRDRDAFEVALIARARELGLPILAICRGIQILNVACGGSLVQDIPSQVPSAIEHRFAVPPHEAYTLAHELWMEKDSLLERLMRERLSDSDSCEANSRHHQALKRVAPGFVVSATAPDGVVEAIEDPSGAFCLGVQWHPENFWRTGEFRPLFEGFLDAARRPRG